MDEWQFFYVAMTGSVTLVTLVFGALVLVQAPFRPANQFLAAFLFLIATNQGCESLVQAGMLRGWEGPAPGLLKQVAFLAAAADPFVLYYFASMFPVRDGFNHPAAVSAVGLGSVVLIAQAPGTSVTYLQTFLLDAFTAVVYLTVFLRFAGLAARDGAGRVERLLLYAAAVAAIPLVPRATFSFVRMFAADPMFPHYMVWLTTTLVLVAAVLMRGRSRWTTATFTRASLLGCGVGAFAFLPLYLRPVPVLRELFAPFQDFVGLNAPVRWLAFSLLVSIAVFRHDILGMSLGARRRAARAAVVMALLVLVVVLGAGTALYVDLAPLRPSLMEALILVLVLTMSVSFRSLIVRVADGLYGLPDARDGGAAVVTYQAAVVQARREGRLLPVDADLARLRRELGLDGATAEMVERAVDGRSSHRLEVGATLEARYHVEWFIGRGGSGRVFRARDWLLDREVCLKEVFETASFAGERLLAEARAAARVRHQNVVAVHDVLPRTGRVVLVTELLPGTLEEHVAVRGPLSFESAVRVYDGVLAGLQAVHEAGVLHRDLKPANVFVATDGTAKIGDFGISLLAEGATLAAGDAPFGGTAGFLAPEVLEGGTPTPASDVFAVGRCMERTLSEEAIDGLAEVVERALAPDPHQRFVSAAQMQAALREAAARRGA